MDLHADWPEIRRIFARSPYSSMATVDSEGRPHVTPIGSLVLHEEPGRGFYFERFTTALPRHLDQNAQLCAMAVDMRLSVWGRALLRGAFSVAPGVRLAGRAVTRRGATEREVDLFQRRVKPARWTKGYKLLWSEMARGREVHFDRVIPLQLGRMWPLRAVSAAA